MVLGKAAGFLVSDWNKDTQLGELSKLSFSLHEELAQRFGDKIDFRYVSALGVASTENEVQLSNQRQLPAWIDGNVLGFQVLGRAENCAQVHPYKLTNAMLSAATEKGTSVMEGGVEGIEWADLGDKIKTAQGSFLLVILMFICTFRSDC